MLTTSYEEDEIDKMYDNLEEIINRVKEDENLIIMGDMNDVVEGEEEGVLGNLDQEKRMEGEICLWNFTKETNFVSQITFPTTQEEIYLEMPEDINRHQMDFTFIPCEFKRKSKIVEHTQTVIQEVTMNW